MPHPPSSSLISYGEDESKSYVAYIAVHSPSAPMRRLTLADSSPLVYRLVEGQFARILSDQLKPVERAIPLVLFDADYAECS